VNNRYSPSFWKKGDKRELISRVYIIFRGGPNDNAGLLEQFQPALSQLSVSEMWLKKKETPDSKIVG